MLETGAQQDGRVRSPMTRILSAVSCFNVVAPWSSVFLLAKFF